MYILKSRLIFLPLVDCSVASKYLPEELLWGVLYIISEDIV